MIDQLIGWLINWLVGWLVDWLIINISINLQSSLFKLQLKRWHRFTFGYVTFWQLAIEPFLSEQTNRDRTKNVPQEPMYVVPFSTNAIWCQVIKHTKRTHQIMCHVVILEISKAGNKSIIYEKCPFFSNWCVGWKENIREISYPPLSQEASVK